jgi:hypothetical protein
MNTKIVKNIIITISIWIMYLCFIKYFYPTNIANTAVDQMGNSATSASDIHLQLFLWKLTCIVPLALSYLILKQEITNLYYKIKINL